MIHFSFKAVFQTLQIISEAFSSIVEQCLFFFCFLIEIDKSEHKFAGFKNLCRSSSLLFFKYLFLKFELFISSLLIVIQKRIIVIPSASTSSQKISKNILLLFKSLVPVWNVNMIRPSLIDGFIWSFMQLIFDHEILLRRTLKFSIFFETLVLSACLIMLLPSKTNFFFFVDVLESLTTFCFSKLFYSRLHYVIYMRFFNDRFRY